MENTINYEENVRCKYPDAFITNIQGESDIIRPNGYGSFQWLGGGFPDDEIGKEKAWKNAYERIVKSKTA